MIPTKAENTETFGSLGGTSHDLSVDLSNLAHIMSVLTDLYSDPEMAVIREYSTNAADSHAMAGIDRAIEVTLPSPLSQTFTVTDFGLGMSHEDIVSTYGTYGSSTKRDTNDATGCLGLGSKSALTYTTMFNVRAVKNGVLTEVAIFRKDGAGSMEVVDTRATDEPNSVKVTIPTTARADFKEKADIFYSVWPKGSVLVNGREPRHITDAANGFWLTKKIYIEPTEHNSSNRFIVMGNVQYPVTSSARYYRWDNCFRAYYFADMGEVAFTPAREELNMNEATTKVVAKFDAEMSNLGKFITEKKILSAKTLDEAVDNWGRYAGITTLGYLDYKGTALEHRTQLAGQVYTFDTTATVSPYQFRADRLHLKYKDRYVFVDIEGAVFSSKRKAQVRSLVAGTGIVNPIVVMSTAPSALYAGCPSFNFAAVEAVVVPKQTRAVAKPKAMPEYAWVKGTDYAADWNRKPLPTHDTSKLIVINSTHVPAVYSRFAETHADWLFVAVPDRRLDKFMRENPTAQKHAVIDKIIKDELPKLTDLDILWHSVGAFDIRVVEAFAQHGTIDDPDLANLLKINVRESRSRLDVWYNSSARSSIPEVANPLAKYPLASYYEPEHSLFYVNAFYNSKIKDN